MDHCENCDHAGGGDDCLLRFSCGARADLAGAAARCGLTNWYAQSARYHRFHRDFISSGVLRRHRSFLSVAAVFCGRICFACAHRRGETLFVSCDWRELRAVPSRRDGLLFLVAAQNDSLFLSRHGVAWLGPYLDGATVLFFCDTIHHRFRPCL